MGMLYNELTKEYTFDSFYPSDQNWLGEGWAIVPEKFQDDIRQNYPYIEVTVSTIDDQSIVTDVKDLPKPPPPPPGPEPEPEPPQPDQITLLQEQVKALSAQNDFLEDCIVEMAGIVYDY